MSYRHPGVSSGCTLTRASVKCTFDGLGYPQEHIDFVRQNNMDAWSLTDHGHMNGFCHAYLHAEKLNAKGANFKFIPGCEMYVHPDLTAWNLDYEIKRAAKRGDESALRQLRQQREELVTPLKVQTDEDDEIVDVAIEDAGLTVENEEETKSGKFYDPIKRRHHLVVLPKTSVGLERLFGLVSRGYTEGFYRFPRVDYSMLKEAAKGDHLLVSTACLGGPLAYEAFSHLQKVEFDDLNARLLDNPALLERVINSVGNGYGMLADAVGQHNVMLELQFNKLPAQHLVNRAIIEFAKRNGLSDQLIVTCDSHYSQPDHWKERELYKKLGWLNYRDFDPSKLPQSRDDLKCELYPKNAQQVWETYQETSEEYGFYEDDVVFAAIERTHDVAHEVIGDIHPDKAMKLPSYVIPEGKTEDAALIDACKKGLVKKGLHKDDRYIERLKTELSIIQKKNFSRYFLTMKSIMDIASEHMFIGPGRGSAAGSLVAYVLGITNVDPIEYGLLFERFLSVHRQGAPDIDSDIGDRDKLIELLKENFGDHNVVPISNYNTFKLKSLVKDISRFYGVPFDEVNAALAPVENDVKREVFKKGTDKNLFTLLYEDAVKYSKSFRDFIEKYPEIAEPIEVLFKQNKALGRHAGGVIVSEDIGERMPLIMAKGEVQTPWVEGMHYKHLEEFGWIKFDLLGLETLRIIERCISLILQRHEGIKDPTFAQVKEWFDNNIDPKVIDFNDQHVYENVYHAGRWGGIFQATQKGAQQFFMKAKPQSIVDIATLTSIYRPGPLNAGVHKIYTQAKANPQDIDYQHPLIKEVLEPTYGAIIFQEQIMQLCNVVAGFPQEDCDKIRRTIMKRSASKADAMKAEAEALKKQFVEGSANNGVPRNVADELYEKILFFSGYGFNKSHAVSYAMDSYFCAWLMTYYEEEWLCAYLESMSGNDKKRAKAFNEVRKLGYKIVPIDINYADKGWAILEGKKFMPSFLSCKGVGEAAIDEIIENRPYNSYEDMLWTDEGKWRHSKFNKRALEALIKIRALDSLHIDGPDSPFESYKHMHEVVINNNSDVKKSTKRDPERGKRLCLEHALSNEGCGEWSRVELAENLVNHLGSCNASSLVPETLLNRFDEMNVAAVDSYSGKDIYWFIVTNVAKKKTRKGKPYLLLTTAGDSGVNERMFMWGWDGKLEIEKYSVCIAEVDRSDFGFATRQRKVKVLK